MPRAVLEIDATTAGIVAGVGPKPTPAQGTERGVRASMGNLFAGIPAGSRRAQQSVYRDSQQITRDQERAAQASVRAFVRAEEQKRRAAQLTAEGRARAERQASEIARAEAQRRGLTAEQEARVRTTALERVTRAVEREERQQTAVASREAARRERDARTIGHGIRRGLNVGRDAAMPVVREAHSQIQDARRQRAESEHTLNAAFYQAGIGGDEAVSMRRQLETALATGNLRGLSMDQVASGLMEAQTQSNVLAGATPQERAARFNDQIRLMEFARNTYQAPSEVMRAGGMLSKQGITGAMQMDVLRNMTGMAQAGSIELSTVMSTALGPMMANIARSTSGNQTAEQRAASVRSAVLETMAVGEITSAGGLTPRNALNALAALRSEVTSPTMAGRVRQRLVNEGRADLADRLTTQDAQGRVALRNQNAVGFVSDLMQGMGGDTNAVINLLRSGGSRNAMVVGSPIRTLISALASQGSGGRTIAENVQRMQAEGTRFGAADIERGRALVETEQRTAMQSAEEKRLNALNDGTNAVVRFSNALDDFSKSSPILSTALQTGGGLVSGVLGSAMINRLGASAAGGTGFVARAVQALTGVGGEAAAVTAGGEAAGAGGVAATVGSGARFLAGRANPVAAFLATMLTPSNVGQAAYDDRALIAAHRGAGGGGAGRAAAAQALNRPPSAQEIGNAFAEALRQAPITATVSPVDATHAATTAAPRR
jgi:hypothetical protein